ALGFLAWRFFALDQVAEQFLNDMTRQRAAMTSQQQAVASSPAAPAPAVADNAPKTRAPDQSAQVTPEDLPKTAPPARATPAPQRVAVAAGPQEISFSDSNYTVNPGETVARLTVRRFGPADRELVFHWRTIDGSAKAERDFVRFRDSVERFA